jgi:hypothetical protein
MIQFLNCLIRQLKTSASDILSQVLRAQDVKASLHIPRMRSRKIGFALAVCSLVKHSITS